MSKINAKWINKDANTLTSSSGALSVYLVASGSGGALESTSNGINVRVSGITNAMLGGSIDLSKLAATVIVPGGTNAFTADQSMGGYKLTNLAQGASNTDAVNLAQLNAAIAGLDFQPDVIAAVDPNVSYPGDGTLAAAATGQRYVLTGATLNEAWGTITGLGAGDIVQYSGTAWAIAYDVSTKGAGVLAWNTTTVTFIRWDGTTWSEFGGLAGVTAGIGLTKTGNTINLNVAETTPGLTTTSGLAVLIDSIGGANLAKAVNVSANGLAVKVDDATIEGDATTGQLKVKAGGIGATQIDLTGTYAYTGDFSVPTKTQGTDTTAAASTAFVNAAVGALSADVPTATNYTPTAATIKGHLAGINTALAATSVDAQETILITADMVTAGYFELAAVTNNAAAVGMQPVDGPRQVNKLAVGTSGATPDFTIVQDTASQLHFNNNGGATGLSGLVAAGDIVVVTYTHAAA